MNLCAFTVRDRRASEQARRQTTPDLKPAPWGGFGCTRTRDIRSQAPRNQNTKRDSSKALRRRFSETVIHLAARG